MSRLKLRILQAAPNLITLAALCAGMTSLRFALEGKFNAAILALLAAAALDLLDGFAARRLTGETLFGAHLDNLSDFLSFGVAPAVFLYVWSLNALGTAGWICAVAFAAAAGVRLARYGAAWQPAPPHQKKAFTGLPTPAAAIAVLVPYSVANATPVEAPVVLAGTVLCVLVVAFFMVSRSPVPHTMQIVSALNGRAPALGLLLLAWLATGAAIAPYTLMTVLGCAILLFAAGSLAVASVASPLRGDAWKLD
jgi:CDP-diacylglycerol--serine O-phosphatidyltransferase